MAINNKLINENPEQEKQDERISDEEKDQKPILVDYDEEWWDSACYPDPRASER